MSLELRQHQLRLRLRRGKEKQEKGLYHPWHLRILLINYPPGILRPLSRLRSMAECGEIHVILLSVIFFFFPFINSFNTLLCSNFSGLSIHSNRHWDQEERKVVTKMKKKKQKQKTVILDLKGFVVWWKELMKAQKHYNRALS